MKLIDLFDDEADMAYAMALVSERILPVIDWLDAHEDEERRVKISTALFIVLTYRAVLDFGLTADNAQRIVKELVEAIRAGESPALRH
jgi:hypothetical protein